MSIRAIRGYQKGTFPNAGTACPAHGRHAGTRSRNQGRPPAASNPSLCVATASRYPTPPRLRDSSFLRPPGYAVCGVQPFALRRNRFAVPTPLRHSSFVIPSSRVGRLRVQPFAMCRNRFAVSNPASLLIRHLPPSAFAPRFSFVIRASSSRPSSVHHESTRIWTNAAGSIGRRRYYVVFSIRAIRGCQKGPSPTLHQRDRSRYQHRLVCRHRHCLSTRVGRLRRPTLRCALQPLRGNSPPPSILGRLSFGFRHSPVLGFFELRYFPTVSAGPATQSRFNVR